jgi:hypothetical protein
LTTSEPTLIIWTIWTVLNAVQSAAIGMPAWAHTLILVVTAALGAVLNRSQVSPVSPGPASSDAAVRGSRPEKSRSFE